MDDEESNMDIMGRYILKLSYGRIVVRMRITFNTNCKND